MSTRRWLQPTGFFTYTPMNGSVVMSRDDIQTLVEATSNASVDNLLFGDVTKWLTSLTYYPIKSLNLNENTDRFLVAGAKDYTSVSVRNGVPYKVWYGFYMGEHYYPQAETFLDYEPYHKVRVWLPYYGYVDVKIADIQGKYMQFRLYVDWQTGMAQYVIGVSDNSITPMPDEQHQDWTDSLAYVDDTNTRIVNTVEFKLGVEIPISSTKFNDKLRDTVLTTLSNAVKIATSIATATIPVSTSSETSKKTYTYRNPTTGRQVTARTEKRETESMRYENDVRGRVNTAVDTAQTVIGVLNLQPTVQTSSNSYLNYGLCNSIVITEYSVEPTVDIFNSVDYKHLNGLPLGETRTISDVAGYTTFSNIDTTIPLLQSFMSVKSMPTFSELAEIEQLLMSGVFCRSSYSISFNLQGINIDFDVYPERIDIKSAKNGGKVFYKLEVGQFDILPYETDIEIENATIEFYSPITGELVIGNITDDVVVTISARAFNPTYDNFPNNRLNYNIGNIFDYADQIEISFTQDCSLDIATSQLEDDNSTTIENFNNIIIGTFSTTYATEGKGLAFRYDQENIRTHYLTLSQSQGTYYVTYDGQFVEFNTTNVVKSKYLNNSFRDFYIPEDLVGVTPWVSVVSKWNGTMYDGRSINMVYHTLKFISVQNS